MKHKSILDFAFDRMVNGYFWFNDWYKSVVTNSTSKCKCILKLTPPEVPNLYHNLTVFPNVERVVFLSGGYPTMEACRRLSANADVTASFSRALSEGLNYNLTDAEFDAKIKNNIKQITEASS